MKTVLLIDDNQDYLDSVRCILEREGLEVFDSDCPDAAYRLLRSIDPPDLIVCDLHMPFIRGEKAVEFKTSFEVGVKTAHELAWVYPETPIVALTALEDGELAKIVSRSDPSIYKTLSGSGGARHCALVSIDEGVGRDSVRRHCFLQDLHIRLSLDLSCAEA